MKHPYDIMKEMDASTEFRLARKSMRHHISIKSFERNASRLMAAMRIHRRTPGTFVAPDGRKINVAQSEVLRNFFNYSITALAMVDHLKSVYQDVHVDNGINSKNEFDKLIYEFESTRASQLMHGIRQYLCHYGIPIIYIKEDAFAFDTKSLLIWGKWQKNKYNLAYSFLLRNKVVFMHKLASEYFVELRKLFTKYDIMQHDYLADVYKKYNTMVDEYNASLKEQIRSALYSVLEGPHANKENFEGTMLGLISGELWGKIEETKTIDDRVRMIVSVFAELEIEVDKEKIALIYS